MKQLLLILSLTLGLAFPAFAQTATYICNEERVPFKLNFDLENETVERKGNIFPFIFDNFTVSWIEKEHDKSTGFYVYEQKTEMLNYHKFHYDGRGVYGSSGTSQALSGGPKIKCQLLE